MSSSASSGQDRGRRASRAGRSGRRRGSHGTLRRLRPGSKQWNITAVVVSAGYRPVVALLRRPDIAALHRQLDVALKIRAARFRHRGDRGRCR